MNDFFSFLLITHLIKPDHNTRTTVKKTPYSHTPVFLHKRGSRLSYELYWRTSKHWGDAGPRSSAPGQHYAGDNFCFLSRPSDITRVSITIIQWWRRTWGGASRYYTLIEGRGGQRLGHNRSEVQGRGEDKVHLYGHEYKLDERDRLKDIWIDR